MGYRISLLPPLANFHDVFHMSHLKRYILDSSHVIQVADIQVKENLTVEASPMQIEDREVKQLHGNEISSMKVI